MNHKVAQYKKPTPEEIQIVADDHFFRKEIQKEAQAFKNKIRNRWMWMRLLNDKI